MCHRLAQGRARQLRISSFFLTQAVEIKSGTSFASDWPQALSKWSALADAPAPLPWCTFGGKGEHERQGCRVMGWLAFAAG